jgi:hypothetical protein
MRLLLLLFSFIALQPLMAQFASDRYVPETLYARLGVREVLQVTTPGGEKDRYWYNAQGKETASESESGIHIRRNFDSLGRLELELTRYYYEKELVQTEAAMFTYDAASGKRASQRVLDEQGALQYRYTYTYDSSGNLLREAYFRPDTLVQEYLYTYHSNGKVKSVQVLDALGVQEETWTYTHDAQGNMRTFTVTPAISSSRSPNHQEYDYNASGLCIENRVLDPMGKLMQRYRMRYNADGLLLEEEGFFPTESKNQQKRLVRYKYVMAAD